MAGFFRNINQIGTRSKSIAFLNPSKKLNNTFSFDHNDFKKNVFYANFLTDEIENMDKYKENISQVIVSLQKLNKNKSLVLCLNGQMFNNNTLMKGITFMNLKFSR